MPKNATLQHIVGLSGAIVAIVLALATGYLAMDRHVNALAVAAISMSEVEHMVDLKTTTKLDEILRRLERIEGQLDRLPKPTSGGKVASNVTEVP
jgi:hypothetical protein